MTDARFRRRLIALLVVPGGLFIVVVLAVVFALPAAAAITCPACYGFDKLRPNVYFERDIPQKEREEVARVIAVANQRVRDFYRGRESSPRTLVCSTTDCYHRIGGGRERGAAFRDIALFLSPRGANPVIASHELSHIEFHHRLGAAWYEVPRWFDEGLAVTVSDDPRYLAPDGAADRCLVEPTGPLPAERDEWRASADEHLYAKAACQVSRWIAANGGEESVLGLVDRLAAGADFEAAYTDPFATDG